MLVQTEHASTLVQLSTFITSTVLDFNNKLGSPSTGSLNATVVGKFLQAIELLLIKLKKNRVSSFKKQNILGVVVKSTCSLIRQFTLTTVQQVSSGNRNLECASTTKQKSIQLQRNAKPEKTIAIRDDSLITINLKNNSDHPFSLQDKNDRTVW